MTDPYLSSTSSLRVDGHLLLQSIDLRSPDRGSLCAKLPLKLAVYDNAHTRLLGLSEGVSKYDDTKNGYTFKFDDVKLMPSTVYHFLFVTPSTMKIDLKVPKEKFREVYQSHATSGRMWLALCTSPPSEGRGVFIGNFKTEPYVADAKYHVKVVGTELPANDGDGGCNGSNYLLIAASALGGAFVGGLLVFLVMRRRKGN